MMHGTDIPPEEKEKWSLDRERDADALVDYMKVERVISMQETETGETEYYVKCMFKHCLCSSPSDFAQGEAFTTTLVRGRVQT